MDGKKRGSDGRSQPSRRQPALYCALLALLLILLNSSGVQAQTNAELNRPTATVTQTVGTASTLTVTDGTAGASSSTASPIASASEPVQTDTSPVDFSAQRVPFLLNLPQSEAQAGRWDGPTFTGCEDEANVDYADAQFRINVSAVYTQLDLLTPDQTQNENVTPHSAMLRIVAIGNVGNESHAFANSVDSTGASVGLLSAAGAQSRFLTFDVYDEYTFLCDRIYPTGVDTVNPHVNPPSCQYGPGQVAFGFAVPLNSTFDVGTLWTQVRLSDPSNPARTLTCIEVQTSTYHPDRWLWRLILWLPIALFIALFLLGTIAALATAETAQRMAYKNRAREGGAPTFVRDKLRPMVLSALAGREMVRSPALLRFATPGCWDVLLHLHFIVAISICHVGWPDFYYPFARQAAWASLLGNVTIVEEAGSSHSLLSTNASLPSGDIGAQMGNSSSPLFMNAAQPNVLLNLGTAPTGIERFAAAIGISSSSFFGTCLTIWLSIIGAVIAFSLVSLFIDALFEAKHERAQKRERADGEIVMSDVHQGMLNGHNYVRVGPFESPLTPYTIAPQGKDGASQGAISRLRLGYHLLALHGNLVRALVLFHLPITAFSVFQFAARSSHSTVSVILAVLSFTVFSVLLPVWIIWQIAKTPRKLLYEDANTLLALGPVYHMYAPGSQLFYVVSFVQSLALGVVVGAGQGSGLAQSIIILTIEVVAALASSLWLPWGDGAMMGPLSFMNGVVRIITSVLVLLLSPTVGFNNQARGWLAYVILLLQGIFFVGALLMVVVKIIEAVVRVGWRVRFDERLSGRTAGLGGAIRKIRRRKLNKRKAAMGAAALATPSRSPVANRPIRPTAHSRNASSLSMKHALGDRGTQTPSGDGGRLAYVEYLDNGARNKRPSSMGSDLDFYGSGKPSPSPSNAFNRSDGNSPPYRSRNFDIDDGGAIMAALPPLTPSNEVPSFVRVRGGRTTEERPFSSVMGASTPSPDDIYRGQPRRPQTFAGMERVSPVGVLHNGASQHPYTNRPAGATVVPRQTARPDRKNMSSTQSAAMSAHQSLIGLGSSSAAKEAEKPGFANAIRRRLGLGGHDADDDDSIWSDEEEGVGTWNSQQAADRRVPWTGAVKLKSAFTALKDNLVGSNSDERGKRMALRTEEADSGANAAPSKGFEVVRKPKAGDNSAPRPGGDVGGGGGNEARRKGHTSVSSPSSHYRRESEGHRSLRASDYYQTPSATKRIPSSPAQQQQQVGTRSPHELYAGSLGILGADMQQVTSSAGHSDEADDEEGKRRTEEQFWLPPVDVRTDDEREDQPLFP